MGDDDDDGVRQITVAFLAQTRIVDYNAVGSVALLVYDTILTLDREVALVWTAKWSPPKLLYFIARYFGVISQIINVTQSMGVSLSTLFCQRIQYFAGATCQLLVAVVQIILIQRVRAFYLHNTFLRWFLALVLVASTVAQIVMLGLSMKGIRAQATGQTAMGGCLTTYVADLYDSYWLPALIVDGILFVLVLARVAGVVRRGWDADALYVLWVHDGVVFFALIFVALITCWSVLHFAPEGLEEVAVPWLVAIFSISGARLHLNQQEARAALMPENRKSSVPKALHHMGADLPFHIAQPQTSLGIGADTSVSFGIASRPPTGHVIANRHYDAGEVYIERQRQQLHPAESMQSMTSLDVECGLAV